MVSTAVKRYTSPLLVALLMASHAMAQRTPLEKSEKEEVVETVANILTVNYVYPDRAALAKIKITDAMAAGDYEGIADPSTFARVDRLKGNIGYIKLLGFPPPGPFNLVADQAMGDLVSTDALIIDMRDNGGGNPNSVAYLCSYFFDPKTPVHINDLIYRKPGTNEFITTEFWTKSVATPYLRKPVYLLTSKRTFSGGEEFVNDLKMQKRAKVFGETTGGGANPGGDMPINSRFSIFVPSGRAENPVTKTSWDGTGITRRHG
jgi:C-terminal processing protease CtpA/Prc